MVRLINVNDLMKYTNIGEFLSATDLSRGLNYIDNVEVYEDMNSTNRNMLEFTFNVNYYHFEEGYIILDGEKIKKVHCSCNQFNQTGRCFHIGAAILLCYKDIFPSLNDSKNVTNMLLDKYLVKNNITLKKELNLELVLDLEPYYSYYYSSSFNVKISIGENRLYNLNNKVSVFSKTYETNDGEAVFGKNFVYDPKKYYFSEENKVIIDAFLELTNGVNKKYYSNSELKTFLKRIKNNTFIIENYVINGIIDGFPIKSNLSKKDDLYKLNFDLNDIHKLIEDDYEYIFYHGNVYHLNNKEQELLETLIDNDLKELSISKEKIETFTKGLMNIVKKEMDIDASVDDIVVTKEIVSELYFDIRKDHIIVNIKFIYDKTVVDYFDKNSLVLRDMELETNTINDVLKYGFVIEKEKVILVDLEKQVSFIENGLEELASKYVVYTTEKFKKVNIRRKTAISSTFSIGKDNILSFNFNLGDLKSDELVNIFKSIKNKKKYFKLKNGDILDLEDEKLQELEDLSDELELTDDEIIAGKGNLLKYRAIYLDSLKNTKYDIINTNNLFDDFIKRFYKYKNSELTLADLSILRDYQVTGVKWLVTIDKTGFGGILADEMGLGKTIQIIYYIKEMLKENSDYKFLIVVPTSLAYNWDHEFMEFANEIKRVICIGNKDKRKNILDNIAEYNVIITTYGILREDEDLYLDKKFHAVIIDEAQNIKNNMAGITKCVKKIYGDVKFALTGTPLENSILELWSIFDFIMPGYLANLTKFQSKYKIKDFDEDSDKLIKGLSHQINPFILRRKKKDVVLELPDKIINDIYIDLDSEQKKLYVAELERVKKEMDEILDNEGMSKARFLILQLLTKLRQICIDPSIVYENYDGKSNKIDTLVNIVNEYISNEHKILIFSSFKTALNIVKNRLDKEKIKYFMIDGSVASQKRIEMVDEFNQNNAIKVFLIMLKSGGTGLNLTGADVVIHLDLWWNPQAENQATDRAHRIGQVNNVEVIHLISKGTIEEKILELQNKKRILSDKLIDGEIRDKNILSELTEQDIKNLLSYENKD